ncbi:CRISPR-associated endonuclease Cas1 [Candidatus Saccharibacteria bacterium]|nr:CRISPR-associated endonuclease Cas1 [Candidatus Saccharibacteria bacterium]
MLTRPEIESKQLLAVTVEPGKESRLRLRNKNIVYEKDGEIVNQCSLSRVLHLMIIGDISITTNLIRDLNEHGISVCLLKSNLKPYAYFGFEHDANFLLREQQYKLAPEQNLRIARQLVADKIHNQTVLLRRISADESGLYPYFQAAQTAVDAKELLGIEGSASKLFFNQYFEPFGWMRRSPRTKEDILNFLLDIGYTVLFNFTDAVCRHFGLDTYKGVYHTQFFARKSLVCDLMEPFRCLIDNRTRTALTLKTFTRDMFQHGKYGVYTHWKDTSKIVQTYAEEVMDHRQQIFQYVRGFYRHVMEQDNALPTFRLKR